MLSINLKIESLHLFFRWRQIILEPLISTEMDDRSDGEIATTSNSSASPSTSEHMTLIEDLSSDAFMRRHHAKEMDEKSRFQLYKQT